MIPTLPENDPHASRRRDLLSRARQVYRYDYSDHGLPYPEVVPPDDQYTLTALGRVAQLKLEASVNELLSGAGYFTRQELREVEARIIDAYQSAVPPVLRAAVHAQLGRLGLRPAARWATPEIPLPRPGDTGDGEQWPLDVEEHRRLFTALPLPPIAEHWREDWCFAYQRLAGTNPVEIRRFDPAEHAERFPVGDAHLERALRFFERPPMPLVRAHAEGRLYWVDYAILDGVATGVWDRGRRRQYLYSPMALFIQAPAQGSAQPTQLLPVAIQCAQRPDPLRAPIFVPGDGVAWDMAKLAVQIADTHTHGIVQHLLYCHLYLGCAALAAFRNLAPNHPLRVLLEPHFEFTLITDHLTRTATISPGGVTETFQATSYEGIFQLAARGRARFEWDRESPLTRYAERGVDDPETLPSYAFRDDELRCFAAVHEFVESYLALYYADDAAVDRDHELRAFVDELGAPDGGQVPGIAPVRSLERLVRFTSEIIGRATSYHNAINYSVYPFMGFVPNQPLAGYAPAPDGRATPTREDYLAMMPPLSLSIGQMNDYFTVSGMLVNRMGRYRRGHFRDRRVAPLVEAFQAALRRIDDEIDELNRTRPYPYRLLKPSMTAQSITV